MCVSRFSIPIGPESAAGLTMVEHALTDFRGRLQQKCK